MSIANFFNIKKKQTKKTKRLTLRMMEQKIQKHCVRSCKVNAGDVFPEGLNNLSCCNILFNCLKLKGFRGKISKYI